MKCVIILCLIVAATAWSLDEDVSFDEWQTTNKVKFANVAEKKYREKVFKSKRAEIKAHNANRANTYKKGLNKFSHMSSEEFTSYYCGATVPKRYTEQVQNTSVIPDDTYRPLIGAPVSLDLRYLMQPVQDQEYCGSCWAFAALAQIEGKMKMKNSAYNTVLSPQYLVDCDTTDNGCFGGWPERAMNWIKNSGDNAAPSMSAYPYTAVNGICKPTPKIPLGIKSVNDPSNYGNEEQLKNYVANYGPISVAIYAGPNFQLYESGIFYDPTCAALTCYDVNHGVVIAGYGSENGQDYWIVKNSWGTGWGESGYIRMARNSNNNCLIACWPIWAELF